MRISDWSSDVCSSDLTLLDADREPDRLRRPGALDAIGAKFAADARVEHGEFLLAAREGRRIDIVIDAGVDRAETEHVHRHAVRIAAVDDRFAGRHAVDVDDLTRLLRSEERRVGKEWVVTCSSLWAP